MPGRKSKAPPPPPPCEARGDGKPCEYEENTKSAELVCKHCGRVGERVFSAAQSRVFEAGDEKKLRADRGATLGPLGTTMGAVYTSNTSSLYAGSGVRAVPENYCKKRRVCCALQQHVVPTEKRPAKKTGALSWCMRGKSSKAKNGAAHVGILTASTTQTNSSHEGRSRARKRARS